MKGTVASPHPLASEAGLEVLRAGGNAFDAVVAANAVLCVVLPHMTSLGGDLFALAWPAGADAPIALDGAGPSGSGATIEAVRRHGFEQMPQRGAMAVTVPGTVAAWGRLIETYGRFGFGRLVGPAAALARDGYIVTPGLAEALGQEHALLASESTSLELFPPVKAGMLLRNPDLASTLDRLGREGFGTFYRGAVAAAIVQTVDQRGGFVTAGDLAGWYPRWVEPISIPYREHTVHGLPPPTQGLAGLGILARLAQRSADLNRPGPGLANALAAARDAVYPMRDRWIADPAFVTVDPAPFLDPAAALGGPITAPNGGDTVCLSAADEEGNLVIVIQSVAFGFGSGIVVEGSGFVLQNRGAYFNLDPVHPNRLEPGKRPMHTLIAGMASRDGRPVAAFGSMGGEAQPQFLAQVAVNLLDGKMSPRDAVGHPRVRVDPMTGLLNVEADYPGAAELQRGGGVKLVGPRRSFEMGHATAITAAGDDAFEWDGGADPRCGGAAIST